MRCASLRGQIVSLIVGGAAGCGGNYYDRIYLDPVKVERREETAVCFNQDRPEHAWSVPLGTDRFLQPAPPAEDTPTPAGREAYFLGPDANPPSLDPGFNIAGGITLGVGLATSFVSAWVLLACANTEDCNEELPGATALTGIGVAIVGAILLGIGGNKDHIQERGEAALCTPVAKSPATP